MEGLGIAACTARPLVFGSALLRRVCILFEQAVTWLNESGALMGIGFLVLPRKLCARQQMFFSVIPSEGSAHRSEPASNRCGRALAASEAGRTARADATKYFDELARPNVGSTAWDVQAFEYRTLQAR